MVYYGTPLSPNQLETVEGFLICRNVPVSRIGAQQYLPHELGMQGTEPVTVHRSPEAVFDPAALASFEGKPVTDGHPMENVSPETFGAFARGHVQNVRRDGEYMVADLYVNDPALISDIKNKIKVEVSCGYTCEWAKDEAGNIHQTNIRGNHVAVVPSGRAGAAVAIKDAATMAAEKESAMTKLTKGILAAFGIAVKDASPEETDKLIESTAAVLDAVPADKAPEAEPTAAKDTTDKSKGANDMDNTTPTADVKVESIPKGDDIGTKLDRLIEMMGSLMKKEDREEKKLRDESDIDELIQKLTGGETIEQDATEEAAVLPANDAGMANDQATRDAALLILRRARPVIADIKDPKERSSVADALIGAIEQPGQMGKVLHATADGARKMADAASQNRFEKIIADQQSAYDKRRAELLGQKKEG